MLFNYTNSIDSTINYFFLSDARKRKYLGVDEFVVTDEIVELFRETVSIYETCLHDFFNFYSIDTDFLKYDVKIVIEQFPWIFNYCFDNKIRAFSMDVSVNYSQMEVMFSVTTGKHVEGNVIYLDSIQDKYLRKLNLLNLPISYMSRQEFNSSSPFLRESILNFTLKYEISNDLLVKLSKFNKFIDAEMSGLRELFIS